MEITYRMQDGFLLPNLMLPAEPEVHLGKYAELRRQYLMKHRRVLYTNLKTTCRLTEHLAEIEQTAQKMVAQTVAQLAQVRRQYLMKHRRVLYTNLKTTCRLTEHLAEIEQTAQKMVAQTVAQLAQAEGVTETMKENDPQRWVGLMNNFKHTAEEQVLNDLIYS